MEYGQELDKIKTEVTNSGKKLEDLSQLMQNLSGLTKLQDSINNFQEDNVLNRIETKIDILAQTDYSELFNFSVDNLKEDLTQKNDVLTKKISSVEELISHSSDNSEKDILSNLACLETKITELSENISSINNPDNELIKSKINYISTKLNEYNQSIENSLNEKGSLSEDLTFLKDNFYKINEKFSEITHLIRTNTAESEELNNRFESNITSFNSGFHNIYERFNNLDNTFNSSFADFKSCIQDIYDQFSTIDSRSDLDQLKFYVQSFNNKILSVAEILETLKENNFSLKIDNNDALIKEKTQEINEKIKSVLDETKSFSNKISDEFSSLASPLSSAIELTSGLKESIDELLSKDDMQVKKETGELLDKFENVYKNAENNFEYIFNASKLFYEKLEEVKNDFSNISYDTNSKISDFISKADSIEFKIQNNLSTSEKALNSLKNISRFTETQINLTSESINLLKTGLSELAEEFGFFKNDITDISSKLNKLILKEKENTDSFISSFEDLKEEINNTSEKIVKNISPEFKDLNKKIDKTEEISTETLETAKDVKSALVYMAEWFDSAGKLLEENNKNSKKTPIEIERTNSVIKRTEENLTEQIKRISDKLNRFEIRMESIEGKIEKLDVSQSNREVLNVLSDILEKVELANERSKSNELILNRLENLELKLEDLEAQKTTKSRKRLAEEKV